MNVDLSLNGRKITVLNVLMDERLGGPQIRVLQVAKSLRQYQIETIVCLPNGKCEFTQLLENEGIRYQQLNLKRLRATLNPLVHLAWLFWLIPNVISLLRLIKKFQVDIVHNNGIRHLQAPWAAKLSGANLVWHLNDINTPKVLKKLFLPFLYILADQIAVASEGVAESYFLGRKFNRRICTLYAPVDTSKFQPGRASVQLKSQFDLKQPEAIVGIIANFNPVKGFEYFIHATAIIKNKRSNVKFIIVGSKLDTATKYYKKILSLVEQLQLETNIIFTGFRHDIPEIMNLMDIYVLSSVAEACPVVVLEAMASGKPVVGTNVGGVAEQIVDGETGILVPPKNPGAIADAVLYLLDHPEKARQMGFNGREHVKKYFSLEKCVEKHRELYLKALTLL